MQKMKKIAVNKGMDFLLKDLKSNNTLLIEFVEQPKERVREVDREELHMALGTMKLGERLLVRFNGSNENTGYENRFNFVPSWHEVEQSRKNEK